MNVTNARKLFLEICKTNNMLTKFDEIKRQMKFIDYIQQVEYAKINGYSRQFVTKLINAKKIQTISLHGRIWVYYKNEEQNPLIIFEQFGYKSKTKSLLIGAKNCIVSDIKLLNVADGKCCIRLYNDTKMTTILFNIKDVEIHYN